MKKLLFALVLLVAGFGLTTTSAQSLKFGVVGGLSINKLDFNGGSGMFKSDNRYGWYIGPKLHLGLPLGFGADASVQYSQRRLNLGDDYSNNFKSIEIPINVRYNIGLGSLASVYVATGPQFGFNVGDKRWDFEGINETFSLKKRNTSWNVGAGVKLFGHVEAGVLYNIALSKYSEGNFLGEDYDFKNNTWQVQVGYIF